MTKSFLEIAREIAELVETRIAPDVGALLGEHCPYCRAKSIDDDDHECEGFEPDTVALMNEPALDREGSERP